MGLEWKATGGVGGSVMERIEPDKRGGSVSLNDVAALLETDVAGRGVVGLAYIRDGEGIVESAWTPTTLPEEPAFLAYSITKIFTAAILLLLQERGALSLDAPLADWFPNVPNADVISLRQILQHTSGLPDYGGLPEYQNAVRNSPSSPWEFDQFVAETVGKGLAFQPGKGWGYSNPGFMFLKKIAEQITGRSYSQLLSRLVAEPLGLQRTVVPESVSDLAHLAVAPSALLSPDGTILDTREHYHPGWVSHGVVASIPSEIALFIDALAQGRLISVESLRQMTTLVSVPLLPNSTRWNNPSYGLGIMADPKTRFGAMWGHNGGGPGYSTSVYHAPELGSHGITVCVMAAIEQGFDAEGLMLAVMELVG